MDEIKYDKPHKSFKQQLKYLENKYNLIVDYKTDISIIKSMSYYDLINGTKDFFMVDDKYINGTTLKTLALFNTFDKAFQSIIFKYSLYAETKYKNLIANFIAEEIGCAEVDYLETANYTIHKTKNIYKTLTEIKDELERENPKQPTKHYLENKNHVPPWILFKNVSFSTTIDLYYFLNSDIKERLSKSIITKIKSDEDRNKTLINSITIIRQFRNQIAHNYQFTKYSCKYYPLPPRVLRIYFSQNMLTNKEINSSKKWNDIYSLILSLILINDHNITRLMIEDIESLIEQYEGSEDDKKTMNLYFEKIGFPVDFRARLHAYSKTIS